MAEITVTVSSCMRCPRHYWDYTYTSDWFDEDVVGYCDHPALRGKELGVREVGYGTGASDFPIPDWCPLLGE